MISKLLSLGQGYLAPIAPYALIAKECYRQYGELLKDVEKAMNYEIKMRAMADKFIKHRADYEYVCNLDQFISAFNEFSSFLDELKADGGVRKVLQNNQKLLNESVQITKAIQDDPEKIKQYEKRIQAIRETLDATEKLDKFQKIKKIWSRANDLITTGFIYRWPEWYRAELNYVINRMNMAFDGVLFDINMRQSGSKGEKSFCPMPARVRMDVEEPLELDGEFFYDAPEE